jgi:hypothetical protein
MPARRPVSRLLVLTALVVAASACSLLVDTSGLAGDAADGGAEASLVDALDGGGAQPDATAGDAAEGNRPPCTATFCDDFDDGGLEARWGAEEIATGGVLVLDSADSTSAPNALHARLTNPTPSGDYRYAVLRRTLPVGRAITCEFDVKVLARPENDFADLIRIETAGGPISQDWVWFGVQPDSEVVREDIFYPDSGCECPRKWVTPPLVAAGKWTHVKVESDYVRSKVTQDGQVIFDEPSAGFLPDKPFVVSLGVSGRQSGTVDALFDSFACTVTP